MPLRLDRHVPSSGVPELQRRLGWASGFVALALLVLVGRLWQLQVLRGERYFRISTGNFIRSRPLVAMRGLVKDRAGVILVDNQPSFNVYVTPRYFTREARATLIRVLDLSAVQVALIDTKLQKTPVGERERPVLVFGDVTRDWLALIEQERPALHGVEVVDVPDRHYPYGKLLAHALGYLNEISAKELEEHKDEGYEAGEHTGRYGIERQWEKDLRGKKGREVFVVDRRMRRKSDREARELLAAQSDAQRVEPSPGHNLILTVDVDLSQIAEQALRDHPTAGVAVVEAKTGRILTLLSKPAFDPNLRTGPLSRDDSARLNADPFKPFVDRTLRLHYPPGSTYKFVTALAALESGLVTPDDRTTCSGWHELGRRCTKAHGSVALYDALVQSCNVYFWRLAEKVKMDAIGELARDFGFGAPTGLGLNGDRPGLVPWKEWYRRTGRSGIGHTLNTAIGQGDTEVTVLQLALAYAAVGNGGDLWLPQIVERVEAASGEVIASFPPNLRRRVKASVASLEQVKRGLWGVVNDPRGTARSASHEGLSVAGKTGTAQVRKLGKRGALPYAQQDHAWFAGFAPADDPEIAIAVLVEHGGHGGAVAAPIAMEIIRGYFHARRHAEVTR